jgi:hypothetical protein
MLKFTVSILSWWCRWSFNLFGSLVDQRAVGSGGPYVSSVIVFHFFFLACMLFYVGDARIYKFHLQSMRNVLSRWSFILQILHGSYFVLSQTVLCCNAFGLHYFTRMEISILGAGALLAADRQSTSSSGYRASFWDPWPNFILLFFFRLTITWFFFLRRSLWRENGSVVYSAITH